MSVVTLFSLFYVCTLNALGHHKYLLKKIPSFDVSVGFLLCKIRIWCANNISLSPPPLLPIKALSICLLPQLVTFVTLSNAQTPLSLIPQLQIILLDSSVRVLVSLQFCLT